MDVLTTFGELNEDIVKNKKYAKWKAAYIHNCLKNGETPVSGPVYTETDEENELNELLRINSPKSNSQPSVPMPSYSDVPDPSLERGTRVYLVKDNNIASTF